MTGPLSWAEAAAVVRLYQARLEAGQAEAAADLRRLYRLALLRGESWAGARELVRRSLAIFAAVRGTT